MTMTTKMITLALASMALLLAAPAPAQEGEKKPPQDPRIELKERMKQRYPELERLRDAEKAGETYFGLIEVVNASQAKEKVDPADPKSTTIAALLEAENKDRMALFELLAADLKLTAGEIGKQNGVRRLEKAKDNHWFKLDDGRWVQKKAIRPEKKKTE
jgi:uncharacterized protein YdbL (DUF1318 family)